MLTLSPAMMQARVSKTQPVNPQPQSETLMAPELCFGPMDDLLLSRIAGGMLQPKFSEALDNLKTAGLRTKGLKSLSVSGLRAGAMGAALSAIYAGIHRGTAAARGQISKATAVSHIASDAVGGFCTGSASGLGSGASSLLFRSLGVAGIPLSLGTATLGAMSGIGASLLYSDSGLRQRVYDSVQSWLQPQETLA